VLALYVKVTNLSFASEQTHAAELSQLDRILSADVSDRQRAVAKSITISIAATQSPRPICWMLTQRRCWSIAVYRRWSRFL